MSRPRTSASKHSFARIFPSASAHSTRTIHSSLSSWSCEASAMIVGGSSIRASAAAASQRPRAVGASFSCTRNMSAGAFSETSPRICIDGSTTTKPWPNRARDRERVGARGELQARRRILPRDRQYDRDLEHVRHAVGRRLRLLRGDDEHAFAPREVDLDLGVARLVHELFEAAPERTARHLFEGRASSHASRQRRAHDGSDRATLRARRACRRARCGARGA